LKLVNPEWPGEWRTIVGVVDDVRYSGLDDPNRVAIYTPFEQTPFLWSYVLLRLSVPPDRLVAAIRSEVRAVAPTLAAARIRPMDQIVSDTVAQPRFAAALLSAFGLLALLLASIGISGVISQAVAQRTAEIGIRVALGARSSDVLRLIAGQGIRLVLLGLAAGILAALAATRVLGRLLFEVSATDPLTFLSIGALLASVGLLASFLPARRALKVDPMNALRSE
jgi:putative ABC transport system permease protein